MTIRDCRHAPLSTGSPASVAKYDQATTLLAGYYLDPWATIEAAVAEEPTFVSGHCLRAALGVLAGEPAGLPLIADAVATGQRLSERANARERAHFAAARAWLDGEFHRSNELYGAIALEFPTDLLALQVAHVQDFALGQQRLLRDRILHALPGWDPAVPGYGFVLGMLAFGLEETNHFDRAVAMGLRALETNARDPWAVHAVAHAHEMNGRTDAGITWLESRAPDWAPNNGFAYHNYWHLALFYLEAGDTAEVLRLYDEHVWPARSSVALELVDAAALLWRLHLRGVDTADRALTLANVFGDPGFRGFYAFNDVHATMALVAAGRLDEARRLVTELERAAGDDGSNAAMVREVGLPVATALLAFGEGRYGDVVEALWPVRQIAHRFGGSNAQRDVIDQTLGVAALRAGRPRISRALAAERELLRPASPWVRLLRAGQVTPPSAAPLKRSA